MNGLHTPSGGRISSPGGFTLIEIMVSMTVLALLGYIVSQILSSTTKTTTGAEKLIDANNQARLIFDRMSSDFGGIAKNPTLNYFFKSKTGNDEFYFFSEATGHFSGDTALATFKANSFSLIGYRVNDGISSEVRHELERLGRGLQWDSSAAVSGMANGPGISLSYLPATINANFGNALADPYNNSSNLRPASPDNIPQWDVLGSLVFRMEYCFMLKNGSLDNIPVQAPVASKNELNSTRDPTVSDDSSHGYVSGSRWYNATDKIAFICSAPTAGGAVWAPLGWQDVQAVIVAIAIVDQPNRQIAPPGALKKLAAALPDFDPASVDPFTHEPFLMSSVWGKLLDQPGFVQQAGFAAGTSTVVRVYQQYFYLN